MRRLLGLSVRNGPLKVAGRNGHVLSSRIRPAVGDQAGGFTEAKTRNTSPEKDDDWIKISQYVSKLNPAILDDATLALKRKKWRGEGIQQKSFEQACVGSVAAVSIACTSEEMCTRVQELLRALLGAGGRLDCAGLQLRVKLMGATWFRSLRKPADAARLVGLEFASNIGSSELRQACEEREIRFTSAQEGDGVYSLQPADSKPGGLMQQVGLALSTESEVVPPEFTVKLSDSPPTDVSGGDSISDLQVRVKEIVLGSEWDEHGPFERFLDRLAGAGGRISLGLWQLPSGPAIRLVPTDDTGLKSIVFHVSDAESAMQALKRAGFSAQTFPGYLAVQVRDLLGGTLYHFS